MKKKITILAMIMMLTTCFNFVFASASAQTKAVEANVIQQSYSIQSLSAPTCSEDWTTYNQVTVYRWTAGNGTKIAISPNEICYDRTDSQFFCDNTFPYDPNDTFCIPFFISAKSYIEVDGGYEYSSAYTISSDGHPCKFQCVDRLMYWVFGPPETVPTTYNNSYFTWDHHSEVGHSVRATIEYQGIVADMNVNIPLLFNYSTNVVINGVTFYLRVGYQKCFLKTLSPGILIADLKFSFGVGDPL